MTVELLGQLVGVRISIRILVSPFRVVISIVGIRRFILDLRVQKKVDNVQTGFLFDSGLSKSLIFRLVVILKQVFFFDIDFFFLIGRGFLGDTLALARTSRSGGLSCLLAWSALLWSNGTGGPGASGTAKSNVLLDPGKSLLDSTRGWLLVAVLGS